jgi:hypothetical protein
VRATPDALTVQLSWFASFVSDVGVCTVSFDDLTRIFIVVSQDDETIEEPSLQMLGC